MVDDAKNDTVATARLVIFAFNSHLSTINSPFPLATTVPFHLSIICWGENRG